MNIQSKRRLLATSLLAGVVSISAPAAVVVATTAIPSVAAAQDYTSGNLTGRVEDGSGTPISGATVTITSTQGQTRTATTDENGRYLVTALPVGAYSADVTAPGQPALTGQRVAVQPGGSSFNFTVGSSSLSEIVVGVRRTPDFARTDVGQVFDVQELAREVPVGRSISAVSLLTPGVSRADPTINAGVRRNQSVVTVAGTSGAESSYYINGLNVTDMRNLLGYADLPFDAIQSIDVKTGGYQAEFGRATGGVVNMVTRSGSNEWHGGLTFVTTPDNLRTDTPNAFAPGGAAVSGARIYNNIARAETNEGSVWLSGPLIKDKLFFFALYNPRTYTEQGALTSQGLTGNNLYTGVQLINHSSDPRYIAKIDWNITDNHRLEATYFSDKTTTSQVTRNYDVRTGPSAPGLPYDEIAGGTNQIYKYTGHFTDWFTLSALYGKTESSQLDTGPLSTVPRIRDRRGSSTTFLTGALTAVPLQFVGEDVRDTWRVDGDFYFKLLGDHHVRIGYDSEKLKSTDSHGYNGGFYEDVTYGCLDPTAAADDEDRLGSAACETEGPTAQTIPYATKTLLGSAGTFNATQNAYYIQDSWDVSDRLTIQAGLRLDQYNYKNRAGQSYIKLDDQYAPRVGFTYDAGGDGSNKVYGSFGRYYLPIATNTSIREVSGEDFHQEFRFVTTTNGAIGGPLVVDANGQPVLGAKIIPDSVFALPISPDPREISAANIKPMYEEEIILGYEHDFGENAGLFSGWRAGARFIHRDLKSTIEDTDIGRGGAITRYCARTGDVNCRANSNALFTGAYILLNPGSRADLALDLVNGPGGPNLRPVNLTADDLALPKVIRQYNAIELTMDKPFNGVWGLGGSYVISRANGNYEGAVKSDVGQTDTSITQDFDAGFLAQGAFGALPNDHTHTLKVYGTVQLFPQLRAGANFYAQSGRPYGCIGYSTADPSPGGTPSAWFCNRGGLSVPTPRGSQGRTDFITNTDLNLTYTVPTKNRLPGDLSLALDVFNVFNETGVTRVVEQGETTNSFPRRNAALPGGYQLSTANGAYGLPRTYQAPRSARVTLRYAF